MENQVMLQNGMDVYGADDEKLGSIHEVRDNYFVVEKGFFFPKDYYIPMSAVQGIDQDSRVHLNVTKDVALNQDWDVEPLAEGAIGDFPVTDQARVWSAGSETEAVGAVVGAQGMAEMPGQSSEVIDPDYIAASDKPASGAEATRVPVYEEEITPVKRAVDRGAVRIEKELVTEERTVTVPVTEERVRVTRVDSNDPGAVGADAFEEGVIEVPVRGQEVGVETTARKAGEVIVEKEAETRTERVGGTVRREEVRVDDQTVDAGYTDSTRQR